MVCEVIVAKHQSRSNWGYEMTKRSDFLTVQVTQLYPAGLISIDDLIEVLHTKQLRSKGKLQDIGSTTKPSQVP